MPSNVFGYIMIMSLKKENDVKVEHKVNNERILNINYIHNE